MRVLACNKKTASKSFRDVVNVEKLETFYGKQLEVSVLSDKYLRHIIAIRNYFNEKNEARFTDYRRNNIRKLEDYFDRKTAKSLVSKQLAMRDKSDLLVSNDYNSLNPSAMAHLHWNWRKIETANSINIEFSNRICSLFKNGNWKLLNKIGFLKVRFHNPEENIFQLMSVKENIFNDRKNGYEEMSRFNNGDISQHITSVDLRKVVISGGYIVIIIERFLYVSLQINPFEIFVKDMTDERNK